MVGEALQREGFNNLVGIDVSEASLRISAGKGVYGSLRNADLDCWSAPLPFGSGSFAAVVCVGVLSHVKNFQVLFAEWCRVTAPGGLIVFTHRTDLWDGDVESVQTCACRAVRQSHSWVQRHSSPPEEYMPHSPSPRQREKRVRYFVYSVT